jgi:hypothetical protein
MSISNLAAYKAALTNQQQIVLMNFSAVATAVFPGRPIDMWKYTLPDVGATPTTQAIPTNATVGALVTTIPSANQLSIVGATLSSSARPIDTATNFGAQPVTMLICDRLSHQGGLSTNTGGAQTTNLPTAALTRYTTGDGVMIGLTVYANNFSTSASVTASYTNQANTSGRTAISTDVGPSDPSNVGRIFMLSLQTGDTGVRSVESVTITGGVAANGTFGVTLFKPLYMITADEFNGNAPVAGFISGKTGGGIPKIEANACLFAIAWNPISESQGQLFLSEN